MKQVILKLEINLQKLQLHLKFPSVAFICVEIDGDEIITSNEVQIKQGQANFNYTTTHSFSVIYSEKNQKYANKWINFKAYIRSDTDCYEAGICSVDINQLKSEENSMKIQLKKCPNKQAFLYVNIFLQKIFEFETYQQNYQLQDEAQRDFYSDSQKHKNYKNENWQAKKYFKKQNGSILFDNKHYGKISSLIRQDRSQKIKTQRKNIFKLQQYKIKINNDIKIIKHQLRFASLQNKRQSNPQSDFEDGSIINILKNQIPENSSSFSKAKIRTEKNLKKRKNSMSQYLKQLRIKCRKQEHEFENLLRMNTILQNKLNENQIEYNIARQKYEDIYLLYENNLSKFEHKQRVYQQTIKKITNRLNFALSQKGNLLLKLNDQEYQTDFKLTQLNQQLKKREKDWVEQKNKLLEHQQSIKNQHELTLAKINQEFLVIQNKYISKIQTIEDILHQKQQEVMLLKRQLRQLQQFLTDQNQKIKEIVEDKDRLQVLNKQVNEELQRQKIQSKQKYQELENSISMIEHQFQKQKNKIFQLQGQLLKQINHSQQISEQLIIKTSERQKILILNQDLVKQINQQKQSYQITLKNMIQQISHMSSQIQQYRSKQQQIKFLKEQVQNQKQDIKIQLIDSKNQIKRSKQEQKILQTKIEELKTENNLLSYNINNLLQKKDSELQKLLEQKNNIQNFTKKLQKKIDELQKQKKQLFQQIQAKRQQQQKQEERRKYVNELISSNQKLLQQNLILEEKITEIELQFSMMVKKLQSINQNLLTQNKQMKGQIELSAIKLKEIQKVNNQRIKMIEEQFKTNVISHSLNPIHDNLQAIKIQLQEYIKGQNRLQDIKNKMIKFSINKGDYFIDKNVIDKIREVNFTWNKLKNNLLIKLNLTQSQKQMFLEESKKVQSIIDKVLRGQR